VERKKRAGTFLTVCAATASLALVVGCSSNVAAQGSDENQGSAEPELANASTSSMDDWIELWPAEYYSFMSGADDMDDMGGFIDKTGGPHSHANLYQNFMIRFTPDWKSIGSGLFEKSTCITCKGAKFNEWFEEDGFDAYYDRYNEKYPNATVEQDVWSCNTCHADIADPAGTVGAQISTFSLFGASLADGLDAGSAVCAQCHNGLGAYSNLRILDGKDLENEKIDAYKYGTDPESFVKAFVEQASDTGEQPGGKVWVDKDLGIYTYSITHPDIEMFLGSNHESLGLECADCHMPTVRTNMGGGLTKEDYETGEHDSTYSVDSGTTYTSHDASGSPLDSFNALSTCLDCHKAQGVESVEGMVVYVKNAQERFKARYQEVNATGDACLELLKSAIASGEKDDAALDEARSNYAMAKAYLMFANGAGEVPGEKISHNPDTAFEFCDRANAIYEDTMALLG
jgi:nitrite reductase (cytochrome c-552)